MDRTRYSTIAHRDHRFCSPFSRERIDAWIEALAAPPDPRVIDVGCGKGQMLISVLERWGGSGIGIDANPVYVEQGRARGAHLGAALELRAESYDAASVPDGSFDVALCVGSTHAIGTYVDALRELARVVRPGGLIAAGSGYWRRSPDPEYLRVLGAEPDELLDHAGNVRAGEMLGLRPRFAITSMEQEWDAYEGLYASSIETFAAEHPEDPDCVEMLDRIAKWRDAYRRWGRTTLGFGLYVFGKS